MANKTKLVYCGALKRVLAFVVDFSLTIIFTILLASLVTNPIFSKILNSDELSVQYEQRILDSGLYEKVDGILLPIDETYNETTQSKEQFINYLDDKLTYFYTNESFSCSNIEYFNNLKLENRLFTLDESTNTIIYSSVATTDDLLSFYYEAVDDAINNVLSEDDIVAHTSINIILNTLYGIILAFLISLSLFYLVIPLINKRKGTFGKIIFKIGVVNLNNCKIASNLQVLVRFAVFFLECVLSLFTFGVVILLSFTITLFTKNDKSFHDLAANTTLVDLKYYDEKLFDEDEGELSWK